MIQYLYLGRVDYDEGLRLQAEIAELRLQGRVENVLLLLEHPPVLTLGRNADRGNVLVSEESLAARGVTVHEINRGGDVTYHGPGQLVGYPIFDLRSLRNAKGGRMGPVEFVRGMEEALIRLCGGFGVRAGRIAGLTGVWCGKTGNREQGIGNSGQWSVVNSIPEEHTSGAKALADIVGSDVRAEALTHQKNHCSGAAERKIGAIGIHVARGITTHGFAFNVITDLRDFQLIVPCGIRDHAVTSLDRELERELGRNFDRPRDLPSLETVAHEAARQFGLVFGEQVQAVESLEALRAQAEAAAAARPEFPAEDTPLRVPAEVERLRQKEGRPIVA
jgi:lipoyl(octanoyl) transferase